MKVSECFRMYQRRFRLREAEGKTPLYPCGRGGRRGGVVATYGNRYTLLGYRTTPALRATPPRGGI